MYEVEVKVKADHGPVRDRLANLGADLRGTIAQTDTYYDAPDRSFAETDEALRIRRERPLDPGAREGDEDGETRAAITYKGPKVDASTKTREEFETGVSDPDAAADLLSGLGYDPAATVRKERESYSVEGCTVTLDVVDGLGAFVEVEREATEGELDAARDRVETLLERLGLDPDDGITTSYLGLSLMERD